MAPFSLSQPDPDNRCLDESFLETCDPRVRAIYDLWKGKCRPGRLPGRRDVDPAEMVRFLPHLMLVDVHRPGPRFRYRLVGTGEVAHRGFDPTGKSLEEAFSGLDGGYCDGNYRHVAETGQPLFDTTPEPTRMGNLAEVEALFLPLASDGTTVDMVLVYSIVQLPVGDRLLRAAAEAAD